MIDSNIALQVKPPQFDSPLDMAGKAMTLKHLMDTGQLTQIQMQEAQMKLDDMRKMDAFYEKYYTTRGTGQTPQTGNLAGLNNLASNQDITNPNYSSAPINNNDPLMTKTGMPVGQNIDYSGLPGHLIPGAQLQNLKIQQEQATLGKTQEDITATGRKNFMDLFAQIDANPTRDNATSLLKQAYQNAPVSVRPQIESVYRNMPVNDKDIPKWSQTLQTSAEQRMSNAATLRGQNMTQAEKVTEVPILDSAGNFTGKYKTVTTTEAGKGMPATPPAGSPGSQQALNVLRDNYTKDSTTLDTMSMNVRELEALLTQKESPARDLAIRNSMGELTRAGMRGQSSVSQWANVGGVFDRISGSMSRFATGENTQAQIGDIANVVKTYKNQILQPLINQTNFYHSKQAIRGGFKAEDVVGGRQANPLDLSSPNQTPVPRGAGVLSPNPGVLSLSDYLKVQGF